jgi:hypothetical protein
MFILSYTTAYVASLTSATSSRTLYFDVCLVSSLPLSAGSLVQMCRHLSWLSCSVQVLGPQLTRQRLQRQRLRLQLGYIAPLDPPDDPQHGGGVDKLC